MAGRVTTEEFIERSVAVHGDKYDYSKTEYTRRKDKVKIICLEHGEFIQGAGPHLRGSGCKKCGDKNKGQTQVISIKEFKERAEKIHGDKYDYSLIDKINCRNKVEILCMDHGLFKQNPLYHTKGQGCPTCAYNKKANKLRKTIEEFIRQAIEVHGETYNYSLVQYTTASDKVKIICKEHGEFEQEAKGHIQGRGCKKCSLECRDIWSAKKWKKAGERSKYFDSFKCYVIRCWNEEEEFYKIGKTFKTIENRFIGDKNMPYNYEVLRSFSGEPVTVTDLENKLQRANRDNNYKPKIHFKGQTECFYPVNFV